MTKIKLVQNKGYKWFINDYITAKGYLFDKDNILFDSEKILEYFEGIETENAFVSKLREANGSFAVAINTENITMVAVDRLRAIPLFFSSSDTDEFILSDSADVVKDNLKNITVQKRSVEEFLGAGFVLGNDTLYNEIKQIQAGQYLICDSTKNDVKIDFYYKHLHCNFFNKTDEDHFADLDKISKNVFKRIIKIANGRQLVVPLSGGYDSRYIATMLKMLGYENVVCYTYGRKESFEVEISKKVAKKLGFRWCFVEYTEDVWTQFLNDFSNYNKFAFHFSSLPHIQDLMAIKYMSERKKIDENAIVVPGYCGDLLGGSYVTKEIVEIKQIGFSIDQLLKYILDNHLYLKNKKFSNTDSSIVQHINSEINKLSKMPSGIDESNLIEECISVNEAFFTNNKVSKFILDALSNFEKYNLQWVLPLWDNELAEYWYRISFVKRMNSTLYSNYLLSRLFNKYGVDYKKDSMFFSSKKHLLRKVMGKFVFSIIRQVKNKIKNKKRVDFNGFSLLEDYLINKTNLDSYVKSRGFNFTYAIFVLNQLSDDNVDLIMKSYLSEVCK